MRLVECWVSLRSTQPTGAGMMGQTVGICGTAGRRLQER